MKQLFPKQNFNVLSPNSYTHISVRDLNIPRIGLPILLQENIWTDPGNICINRSSTHECGNWDGTEAAQFPEKKYIYGIFVAVCDPILASSFFPFQGVGAKALLRRVR
jgi:hypothetical protein